MTTYDDEMRQERQTESRLRRTIARYKRKLKAKAASGLYENFGNAEYHKLISDFDLWGLSYARRLRCQAMIDNFADWAANYTPRG